jgi:hypothetical protein
MSNAAAQQHQQAAGAQSSTAAGSKHRNGRNGWIRLCKSVKRWFHIQFHFGLNKKLKRTKRSTTDTSLCTLNS